MQAPTHTFPPPFPLTQRPPRMPQKQTPKEMPYQDEKDDWLNEGLEDLDNGGKRTKLGSDASQSDAGDAGSTGGSPLDRSRAVRNGGATQIAGAPATGHGPPSNAATRDEDSGSDGLARGRKRQCLASPHEGSESAPPPQATPQQLPPQQTAPRPPSTTNHEKVLPAHAPAATSAHHLPKSAHMVYVHAPFNQPRDSEPPQQTLWRIVHDVATQVKQAAITVVTGANVHEMALTADQ
ncbi:hypothetical protein FKP32DRAFT_1599449, partial [Trametes sanguinea]